VNSLHALTNHVGGLPTQAIHALAHRLRIVLWGLRQGNTAAVPSEGCICNPPTLSAGWGDPDPCLPATVNNRKSPLSFELKNVRVRNQFGFEWIDHHNRINHEHKFWSDPHGVSQSSQADAECKLNNFLQGTSNDIEAVGSEEKNQNVRHAREEKVVLRSKDLVHRSSLAGRR